MPQKQLGEVLGRSGNPPRRSQGAYLGRFRASQECPGRARGATRDAPGHLQNGARRARTLSGPLRGPPGCLRGCLRACPGLDLRCIQATFRACQVRIFCRCMLGFLQIPLRPHMCFQIPQQARRPVRSTLNPPRARSARACVLKGINASCMQAFHAV